MENQLEKEVSKFAKKYPQICGSYIEYSREREKRKNSTLFRELFKSDLLQHFKHPLKHQEKRKLSIKEQSFSLFIALNRVSFFVFFMCWIVFYFLLSFFWEKKTRDWLLARENNHYMIVVGELRLKLIVLIVSSKNYRYRIVVGELEKINWIYLWV